MDWCTRTSASPARCRARGLGEYGKTAIARIWNNALIMRAAGILLCNEFIDRCLNSGREEVIIIHDNNRARGCRLVEKSKSKPNRFIEVEVDVGKTHPGWQSCVLSEYLIYEPLVDNEPLRLK